MNKIIEIENNVQFKTEEYSITKLPVQNIQLQ